MAQEPPRLGDDALVDEVAGRFVKHAAALGVEVVGRYVEQRRIVAHAAQVAVVLVEQRPKLPDLLLGQARFGRGRGGVVARRQLQAQVQVGAENLRLVGLRNCELRK